MEFIKKVASLARDRAEEHDQLNDAFLGKRGLQIPPGPNDRAYMDAPRPREAELRGYLASLSMNQLLAIEAVMYCGRDEDPNLAAMFKYLRGRTLDTKDAIRTIMEKTPLDLYLSKGMDLVGSQVPELLRALP